mgnify:CR=1 FL=1
MTDDLVDVLAELEGEEEDFSDSLELSDRFEDGGEVIGTEQQEGEGGGDPHFDSMREDEGEEIGEEEDDEEEKHLRVEEAYCYYSYSHLKMQKLKLKNFYSACEREEFAPVTP